MTESSISSLHKLARTGLIGLRKLRLVLVSFLIGRERGARFLTNHRAKLSKTTLKQTQIAFDTLLITARKNIIIMHRNGRKSVRKRYAD